MITMPPSVIMDVADRFGDGCMLIMSVSSNDLTYSCNSHTTADRVVDRYQFVPGGQEELVRVQSMKGSGPFLLGKPEVAVAKKGEPVDLDREGLYVEVKVGDSRRAIPIIDDARLESVRVNPKNRSRYITYRQRESGRTLFLTRDEVGRKVRQALSSRLGIFKI